jgi:hypothetical protein
MQYRGVRYELRTSIVRHEWKVAIYIEENKPVERTIKGSRREAEVKTEDIIGRLLKPSQLDKKVKRARSHPLI